MTKTRYESREKRMENIMDKITEATEVIEKQINELIDLKHEIETWEDNLVGTNLEYTQKYEELEEWNSILDGLIEELQSGISQVNSARQVGDGIGIPSAYGR